MKSIVVFSKQANPSASLTEFINHRDHLPATGQMGGSTTGNHTAENEIFSHYRINSPPLYENKTWECLFAQ